MQFFNLQIVYLSVVLGTAYVSAAPSKRASSVRISRVNAVIIKYASYVSSNLGRNEQKAQQLSTFERRFYETDTRLQRQSQNALQAKRSYFPIPENAKNPEPLPGKSYYVGKVVEDVYHVVKTGYVGMFIVTSSGVVAVDAPPNVGTDYLAAIKDVTNLPVTHLIYSHSHIDHIGNATIFGNAEKVAHAETLKILQQRQDPARPCPTRVFNGNSMTLNIGGKTIQLDYKGPMHTPGNLFIWLPNERVLFSCDIINPGWAPFTRLAVAEDIVAFLQADDVLLSYNFQHLVAGHWGKLGTRKDVEDHREYVQDLQKFTVDGFQSVSFADTASQVQDPQNLAVVIDLYLKAINTMCKEKMEQKWKDRLGGVDVYTESNCDAISMAQMIDYGNKVIH